MNPTERPAIETYYDPKPDPCRRFDWEAVRDGYDLGCLIGYGATEEEAVADLLDMEEEGF